MSLVATLQRFTRQQPTARRAPPAAPASPPQQPAPRVAPAAPDADVAGRPADMATGLQDAVMSQDSITELVRTRGEDYLHVSSLLHNPCARKIILHQTAEEAHRIRHFSADKIVHTLGRAAEHHVRSQYIASVRASGVLGQWTCPCGDLVREMHYDPAPCGSCRKPANIYGELILADDEFKIIGSPDLLVCGQDRLIVPVEIKSMNITDFTARRGETRNSPFTPVASHVGQVSCYHRLASSRFGAERMAPYSLIFYVSKDYPRFGVSPYATVRVDMDGAVPRRWIRDVWALAARVWEARARDALPARLGVCSQPTTPTAKGCECVGQCFLRS